jgi:hypothetical protein
VDGSARADQAAFDPATQAGRTQGLQDATGSDAETRGRTDGVAAGEFAAQEEALLVDYPRGLEDTLNQTLASEPILIEDQFSQQGAPSDPVFEGLVASFLSDVLSVPVSVSVPAPDHRFWNPRRTYRYGSENIAYRGGYSVSYDQSYRATYAPVFRSSWDRGYRTGDIQGCRDGQNSQSDDSYRRGFDEGREAAYREAYDPAYDLARSRAFDLGFAEASSRAYTAAYGPAYARYFDGARDQAFAEATSSAYQRAFDLAKQQAYTVRYASESVQQFAKGQLDEKQILETTPVVLLGADVAGLDPATGKAQVGQALTLQLELRNLAKAPLVGGGFVLELTAEGGVPVLITLGSSNLIRDLQPQSRVWVTDALGFQSTELAAGSEVKIHLRLSYLNVLFGEQDLVIQVAERPTVVAPEPAPAPVPVP